MFICDKCLRDVFKTKVESLTRSRGACEECGKPSDCHDIDSRSLRRRRPEPKIGTTPNGTVTDVVPCDTCGTPTAMTGTRRCDSCWEVEHRIDGYLRDGGRRAALVLLYALRHGGFWDLVRRLAARGARKDGTIR